MILSGDGNREKNVDPEQTVTTFNAGTLDTLAQKYRKQYALFLTVTDENESWLIDENIKLFATNASAVDKEDPDFMVRFCDLTCISRLQRSYLQTWMIYRVNKIMSEKSLGQLTMDIFAFQAGHWTLFFDVRFTNKPSNKCSTIK